MNGWWTEADQAELDVLVHAFIRAHASHRAACAVCSACGPWCPRLLDAFTAVLEWREGRAIRSKATWLRLRELERERDPGRVRITFDQDGEVVAYAIAKRSIT